jgi:CheY-like chemotaxis protein
VRSFHFGARTRAGFVTTPGSASPRDLDLVFEAFAQSPSGRGAESGTSVWVFTWRADSRCSTAEGSRPRQGRGCGSTFKLRLPLPTPSRAGRREAGAPRTGFARRILVVDDNRDAAESLAELLSISGHEVRTAYDGPGAILAAHSFSPDAIVLDIGLPGFDGHEAARKLRSVKETENALLIALTGWVTEDDRARSRDAGFDHHRQAGRSDALERLLG